MQPWIYGGCLLLLSVCLSGIPSENFSNIRIGPEKFSGLSAGVGFLLMFPQEETDERDPLRVHKCP